MDLSSETSQPAETSKPRRLNNAAYFSLATISWQTPASEVPGPAGCMDPPLGLGPEVGVGGPEREREESCFQEVHHRPLGF